MNILYLNLDDILELHDYVIESSGGLKGINNVSLLISALEHIKNDLYYSDFPDKLTHLLYSLVMGHCFLDGNKRTSIAVTSFFLELNGYEEVINRYIYIMEPIVVLLAEHIINKEQLKQIIIEILNTCKIKGVQ